MKKPIILLPLLLAMAIGTAAAQEAEEWHLMGTGRFTDSFFNSYGVATETYIVEVEASNVPGRYRFKPAPEGSAAAALVGTANEVYMVVNATNPEAVYFEDFKCFGTHPFSQLVPEMDWPVKPRYAAMADGAITFPSGSVATKVNGDWNETNDEAAVLSLPGAADYTLNLTTYFCPDEATCGLPEGAHQVVTVEIGSSVARAYLDVRPGNWQPEASDADEIAAKGTPLDVGLQHVGVCGEVTGLYTASVVTFDADDQVRSVTYRNFFVDMEQPADWIERGQAEWDECVLSSKFEAAEMETLSVVCQESLSRPGLYRLVNPLAPQSIYDQAHMLEHQNCAAHCIYIDATDPEAVFLLGSALGVDSGEGSMAIWSMAAYMQDLGYDKSLVQRLGYFGTLKDNQIEIPKGRVCVAQQGVDDGAFYAVMQPFRVKLPQPDGIVAPSTVSRAQEFYTLQGIRIAQPTTPGLYITRCGESAKVIRVE